MSEVRKGKLDELTPDAQNANAGTERGRYMLDHSLRQYGAGRSILVDKEGRIIAGNKTVEAAADIGLDDVVIVQTDGTKLVAVQRTDLDLNNGDDKARLLAYADNRASETGLAWDAEAIQFDLDAGLDLGDMFRDEELVELGALTVEPPADPGPQVDKAEMLQAKWQVRRGQVWQVGRHRLMCGDSTDEGDVERLMGGKKAAMVFTDPPYNVSYQDNESIESLKARNRRTDGLVVSNDAMTDEQFDLFLDAFLSLWPLVRGGVFYLCAPPGHPETQFRNALNRVSGLALRQCIVWVKDRFVFGRQDYHWRHESILYGWRDGGAHYFIDDHTQDTVWEFERPTMSKQHPTMKPIGLSVTAINNSSHKDDIVWDGFLGSGTTLVACEQTNRIGYGMEIEPKYCAVTLERLTGMGLEARLIESDG